MRTSIYVFSLISSVAAIAALIYLGSTIFPVTIYDSLPAEVHGAGSLQEMLIALLTVVFAARILGWVAQALKQPRVVGEIVGGLALGPSLLGHYFPSTMSFLIPATSMPLLSIIAQLGVLLFMFTIGLELDLGILRKTGARALAISQVSIVFPFMLGVILSLSIFQSMAPLGIGFPSFALFIGVSISVTAFPVLARILSDFNLTKTPIGTLALSCAAIVDATAWCLLAFVVGILQDSINDALMTTVLTASFIALMIMAARPLLIRWVNKIESTSSKIDESTLALVLGGLLVSATFTELIGIHALFGAFFFGAIFPSESRIARELTAKLQDLVRVFFLPAFFAYTGLRTEVGLLHDHYEFVIAGLILAVAIFGKFGGAFAAAKLSGMNWRDSAIIGVLMNTRGLVELIVLNVGLDLHVISPRLFTMLVLMAVLTTLATGPGLLLLGVGRNGSRATP